MMLYTYPDQVNAAIKNFPSGRAMAVYPDGFSVPFIQAAQDDFGVWIVLGYEIDMPTACFHYIEGSVKFQDNRIEITNEDGKTTYIQDANPDAQKKIDNYLRRKDTHPDEFARGTQQIITNLKRVIEEV